MSLETEITALREAVERLAELPAALDRLTAAVVNHADTRLRLFERAGQEALAAIPLGPDEDARVALNFLAVPFINEAAANEPAPPVETLTPASLAEVQEVAREMVRSGEGPLLRTLLVDRLGVGSLDQLTAEQRSRFIALACEAGWLPRTQAPAGDPVLPEAANHPHDEPPPAAVSADEARALAVRLIQRGDGQLVRNALHQHLEAANLEALTPAQRVVFMRLLQGSAQEAA